MALNQVDSGLNLDSAMGEWAEISYLNSLCFRFLSLNQGDGNISQFFERLKIMLANTNTIAYIIILLGFS